MTPTDGDDSPKTAETIAAEVRRNTWWAYYGPLPKAPYVRGIIEVVEGEFWKNDPDDDLPRRPVRRGYGFSGDMDWFDFTTEVSDYFSNMAEEEFQRLVAEGRLIPLGRGA